ncbi:MAG TPA: hypothetical protein VFS02_01165 [Telluria sp.]|nr:hypothetical protein [Telluria sp.]
MSVAAINIAPSLAVPQAALQGDGSCSLAFAGASWAHLLAYIGLVERLPNDFGGDEAAVGTAVGQLRRVVRGFGSPALVRQLLRADPLALSGETAPGMTYAMLAWWAGGLQESAAVVASILHRHAGGGGQQEQRQVLAGVAANAKRRIAPLIDALAAAKGPLLDANRALAEASRRAGVLLQRTEQDVSGLHERIGRQERQIAQLGLFGAHRKHDLLTHLHTLQKDRAEAMGRSSRLQVQLGTFDALQDEGAWVGAALADAIDSLDKLRVAWTRFGSDMAALQAFDSAEAFRQWSALERAARGFAAASLVDCAATSRA